MEKDVHEIYLLKYLKYKKKYLSLKNIQFGGKKYSKIILKLIPELLSEHYFDNKILLRTLSDSIMDLVDQKINEDYTNIKSIFENMPDENNQIIKWNIENYEYKKPFIYLTISKSNSEPIFNKIKIEKNINDIMESGPDTWMEGDISIISRQEARANNINWPFIKDNVLELGIMLDKIKFV